MQFRPKVDLVDSRFMMYQLMSLPILEERILEGLKGTTSQHVNIKHLRQVSLAVPQLSKQKHIAAYFDDLQIYMDSLKRLQTETQRELNALLPSILDKAFKGEL